MPEVGAHGEPREDAQPLLEQLPRLGLGRGAGVGPDDAYLSDVLASLRLPFCLLASLMSCSRSGGRTGRWESFLCSAKSLSPLRTVRPPPWARAALPTVAAASAASSRLGRFTGSRCRRRVWTTPDLCITAHRTHQRCGALWRLQEEALRGGLFRCWCVPACVVPPVPRWGLIFDCERESRAG